MHICSRHKGKSQEMSDDDASCARLAYLGAAGTGQRKRFASLKAARMAH